MPSESMNSSIAGNAIKLRPHFRVQIEPRDFEPNRISKLSDLWALIERTRVRLRGWDYPHLSPTRSERENGHNFIGCWSSFSQLECWRLYQSGQFAHVFSLAEGEPRYAEQLAASLWEETSHSEQHEQFLDITSRIWTVTEVFEFASRLAHSGLLAAGASISVELNGVQGCALSFRDRSRVMYDVYRATIPTIAYRVDSSGQDLIGNPRDLALDAAEWIFERFGATFERALYRDIQQELFQLRRSR